MLKSISLRNYPLHTDQMEELGLPVREYACAMADGLAFLLWVAGVDACDVEFVIGRPRPRARPLHGDDNVSCPNTFTSNPVLGPHTLWILDFDCCQNLPMTLDGVKIAAERFWRNDPYLLNPSAKCEEDVALWEVFKRRFLETSAEMMAHEDEAIKEMDLPGMLVARIVETVGVYSKGVPSALP